MLLPHSTEQREVHVQEMGIHFLQCIWTGVPHAQILLLHSHGRKKIK